MRAHIGGAQRTIDPDTQKRCVGDRYPECLRSLPGESASAGICDCHRDHDRHAPCQPLEHAIHGKERGFGIQCVKCGFNQQHIDTAIQQAAYLGLVGCDELIESHGTVSRDC